MKYNLQVGNKDKSRIHLSSLSGHEEMAMTDIQFFADFRAEVMREEGKK